APVVTFTQPWQAPDVVPVAGAVVALELVVGDQSVLVPVLVLGDAEVDKGAIPDVGESHDGADCSPVRARLPVSRGRACSPPGSKPPLLPPQSASPVTCPSTALSDRCGRRAREARETRTVTPLRRRRSEASSSGLESRRTDRRTLRPRRQRHRTSTPRRTG